MTTYTTNDVGDLSVAREDFIGSLAARETEGGTAFANGFLYVSGEGGLEIFNDAGTGSTVIANAAAIVRLDV